MRMLSPWTVIAKTKGVTFGRHRSDRVLMDRLPDGASMAYLSKGSLEVGRGAAPSARSSNDGKTCERHDQKRTRKSDRAFCLTSASSTLFFGCALVGFVAALSTPRNDTSEAPAREFSA
jgi:hypothetical protein